LITMLDKQDEDIDAVATRHPACRQGPRIQAFFLVGVEEGNTLPHKIRWTPATSRKSGA